MYAGIVCLASLACDWVIVCWDSLAAVLHAGRACLPSLAYDWATACRSGMSTLAWWDSMSSLPACVCLVTNGCFNPIGVNSIIA